MSHLKSEGLHSLVVSGFGWSGLGFVSLFLLHWLAGLTAETVLLGHTARLSETLHNCMYTLKRETLGSNLYDNSAITRTEKQKLTGDKMHMAASCWPD